jgi:hypothetical protein
VGPGWSACREQDTAALECDLRCAEQGYACGTGCDPALPDDFVRYAATESACELEGGGAIQAHWEEGCFGTASIDPPVWVSCCCVPMR